jgi:hypothetical protein
MVLGQGGLSEHVGRKQTLMSQEGQGMQGLWHQGHHFRTGKALATGRHHLKQDVTFEVYLKILLEHVGLQWENAIFAWESAD